MGSRSESVVQSDCKLIAKVLCDRGPNTPNLLHKIASISNKAGDDGDASVKNDCEQFLRDLGRECFRRPGGLDFHDGMKGDKWDNNRFLLEAGKMHINQFSKKLKHAYFTNPDEDTFFGEIGFRQSPITDEEKRTGCASQATKQALADQMKKILDMGDSKVSVPAKDFNKMTDKELIKWIRDNMSEDSVTEEDREMMNSMGPQIMSTLNRSEKKELRSELEGLAENIKEVSFERMALAKRLMDSMEEATEDGNFDISKLSNFKIGDFSESERKSVEKEQRHLDQDGHDERGGVTYSKDTLVPYDCSPETLPKWSQAKSVDDVFQGMITMQENFGFFGATSLAGSEDANFEIRKLVHNIGHNFQEHGPLSVAIQTPEGPRQRGIFMFVEEVRIFNMDDSSKSKDNDDESKLGEVPKKQPLYILSWMYGSAANQNAQQLDRLTWFMRRGAEVNPSKKSAGAVSLKTCESAIDLLHDLLRQNRLNLDPAYVKKYEEKFPKGIKVTALCRVQPRKPRTEKCAHCGKIPAKMMRCSRCQKVGYCGKDCQVGHWKAGHKKECAPPGKGDASSSSSKKAGRLAHVQLAATSDPSCPQLEMFLAMSARPDMTSFNMSFNGGKSTTGQKINEIPRPLCGQTIVVKIQVPMGGSCGMKCYDKKRSFDLMFGYGLCPQYAELEQVIRSRGNAGGLKGYFSATMPDSPDGKMVVDIDNILSEQPW